MQGAPRGIDQVPVGPGADLDRVVICRLRSERDPVVRFVPDRPEGNCAEDRDTCRCSASLTAVTNDLNSLADGLHGPAGPLLGTPAPIAHSGVGPVTSRSIPMPLLFAAAIAWSYLAQFAAGYAPGFVALNGFGLLCDKARGSDGVPGHQHADACHAERMQRRQRAVRVREDVAAVLEDRLLVAGRKSGTGAHTGAGDRVPPST